MRSDRPILVLIFAILCVLFFKFCACNVEETEHAVICSFGRPVKVIVHQAENAKDFDTNVADGVAVLTGAGFTFKAPWHSVHRLDSRLQQANRHVPIVTTQGELLDLHYCCIWRISDPLQFMMRTSNETNGELAVERIVGSRLVAALQSAPGEGGPDPAESARAAAAAELRNEGIELAAVYITSMNLSERGRSGALARLADRFQLAAQATLREAEHSAAMIRREADTATELAVASAQRDAENVRGQAEAEAIRIVEQGFTYSSRDSVPPEKVGTQVRGARADPQFFRFLQSLWAIEQAPADRTTIILKKDVLRSIISNPLNQPGKQDAP